MLENTSPSSAPPPVPTGDARDLTAERLVIVHRRLIVGIDRLVAAGEHPDVRELAKLFAIILRGHHDGEEQVLFPALRASSRLRSTDFAFINARAHEHLAISRLAETFNREGTRHATELRALLESHFADEERGLSAERLREMVTSEALHASAQRRPNVAALDAFFGHALVRETS